MCLDPQVYNSTRSSGESPTEWLERHDGLWQLVLDRVAAERVLTLAEGKGWSEVAESLETLIGNSLLGERLFGFTMQEVYGERIEKIIVDGLTQLGKSAELKDASIRKTKSEMLSAIEKIEGIDKLESRRKIKVHYRDLCFELQVNAYEEQVELVTSTAVRGWLVQAELLTKLPGEEHICQTVKEVKVKSVDAN
eukprot:3251039-Amphidinium_carterae.1